VKREFVQHYEFLQCQDTAIYSVKLCQESAKQKDLCTPCTHAADSLECLPPTTTKMRLISRYKSTFNTNVPIHNVIFTGHKWPGPIVFHGP